MKLNEFIKEFVCLNTLIRLWYKTPNEYGHTMISEGTMRMNNGGLNNQVCMDWQITSGKCWMSKYGNCKVVGVTDIVVDGFYKEAVNIVIEKPLSCWQDGCMYYDEDENKCSRVWTTGKQGMCWMEKSEGEY